MSDDEAGRVPEIKLEHLCMSEMRLILPHASRAAWLAPALEGELLRQAVLSSQATALRLAA